MSDIYDSVETEDYGSIYGEDLDEGYDSGYSGESGYGDLDSVEARLSPYQQRVLAAKRRKELERRKRALAQGRARDASAGRQPGYPRVPVVAQVGQDLRRAQAGIEKVDLENKVQTDLFSGALRTQRDRISRNEYALAASTLLEEMKNQFPDLFAGDFGTLLPFASLLLLKPDDKGKTGIEKYLNDPRFVFPALALGLKLFRQSRTLDIQVVVRPETVEIKQSSKEAVILTARDRNGMPFAAGKVRWVSSDELKATVNPTTGEVMAGKNTGFVLIDAIVTQDGKEFRNQAVVHVIP